VSFRESANDEAPKLMELVESLRVDMENCASVIAARSCSRKAPRGSRSSRAVERTDR
jgi:hypothetical protein